MFCFLMVNEVSGLKPLFESKLTSVEDALRELEALPDVVPETNVEPKKLTSEDNIVPVGYVSGDFYVFDKDELLKATKPDYRKFLKDNDYVDIDSCSRLEISKGLLKINKNVLNVAKKNNIVLKGNIGDYVVSINHTNARKLVNCLGYKVLTTQLMYNLFIPYIKKEAVNNHEVKKTLEEMITKVEWLEDIIINKSRLKIGSGIIERNLTLPNKDGRFDRNDLNNYGYPNNIKDKGEHYYWYPRNDTSAIFRSGGSELDLDLLWVPADAFDILGVRLAKFFYDVGKK